LETRPMTIQEKADFIGKFKTGDLVNAIAIAEADYAKILKDQASFRFEQAPYIKGGRGGACEAITDLEAQLISQSPAEINSKKTTQADRDAWLTHQRTENPELKEAYEKQRMAEISIADFDIRVKMSEVKLTDLRAVVYFRVAQINFFSSPVTTGIITNEGRS